MIEKQEAYRSWCANQTGRPFIQASKERQTQEPNYGYPTRILLYKHQYLTNTNICTLSCKPLSQKGVSFINVETACMEEPPAYTSLIWESFKAHPRKTVPRHRECTHLTVISKISPSCAGWFGNNYTLRFSQLPMHRIPESNRPHHIIDCILNGFRVRCSQQVYIVWCYNICCHKKNTL